MGGEAPLCNRTGFDARRARCCRCDSFPGREGFISHDDRSLCGLRSSLWTGVPMESRPESLRLCGPIHKTAGGIWFSRRFSGVLCSSFGGAESGRLQGENDCNDSHRREAALSTARLRSDSPTGASGTDGLPECTIELADPTAHYFFGCGWTAGSLLGGTMFFSRM